MIKQVCWKDFLVKGVGVGGVRVTRLHTALGRVQLLVCSSPVLGGGGGGRDFRLIGTGALL